jgi:hypothetical protein
MNYFLLADTEFFRCINEAGDCNMETAYMAFANQVIELCGSIHASHTAIALAYIEIELQHHPMRVLSEERKEAAAYIDKALSFVRKMQKFLSMSQVPPLSTTIHSECEKRNKDTGNIPAMRWTGSMAELVELIYGLDAMKLVNEGETGIKELLESFCKVFGMEIKESQCYNTYADIKRRKNDSRTYFFDKAAEKLNRRMQEDEERERMRKR